MGRILDYLEQKHQEEIKQAERVRFYNDVACVLWFDILYNNILSYKKEKMDDQREPFRIYQWGNHHLIFGTVKALNADADIKRFIKVAEAELRDKNYGNFKVQVFRDAIIVTQKGK